MNSKVTVILIGVLSCVLADYVAKKQCVKECTSNRSCGSGHICKSVGCNSFCRRISQVLPIGPVDPIRPVNQIFPVDPVGPVDPRWSVDPVGPINPRWSGGPLNQVRPITAPGLSRRRMNSVLPVGHGSVLPGLTGMECRDECIRSTDCRTGAVCARGVRGCRRCQTTLVDSVFPRRCVAQCTSDFDCQHNQRCIKQGRCSYRCVDTSVGQKY